jgi:hypothetical protein
VSGADIPVSGELSGRACTGPGEARRQSLTCVCPEGQGYEPVTATRVDRTGPSYRRPAFQAAAEVTALAKGTSGGKRWVAAGHPLTAGLGSLGGCALVLVTANQAPVRMVTVLEGFQPLPANASLSISV